MKNVEFYSIHDYESDTERYRILSIENEALFSEFEKLFHFDDVKCGVTVYDSEKDLIENLLAKTDNEIEEYKRFLDKNDFRKYSFNTLKMYLNLALKRKSSLQRILSKYNK